MFTPLSKHEVGIVVALAAEAAGFAAHVPEGPLPVAVERLQVAVSGIGHVRASETSRGLVERSARVLVSWGLAGGLAPGLRAGDLLLPRSVVTEDQEWATDTAWRDAFQRVLTAAAPAPGGRLWCSAVPVASVEEKASLASRDLAAADMESAAVAAVAASAGLPFVAVKVICDPAGRALPAAAMQMIGADGRMRLRGLPGLMRGGPRAWWDVLALRSDFAIARRGLRRAALALSR